MSILKKIVGSRNDRILKNYRKILNDVNSLSDEIKKIEDSDFKGIISEEMFHEGWVAPVLCEGCGYIEVDNLGKRIEEVEE